MVPKTQYLPSLDGWRGLAIAFLLVGHFFPVVGINLGAVGVNLFFVLSGLLMARILFVDKVPIATFYRRRISRIFPSTFAFLAITLVVYLVAGRPVNWGEFWAAATFLKNYFPGEPGNAQMPFNHIWSLSVEEHSYVLLSLVAIFVRRKTGDALAPVGILAALFAGIGVYYWATYTGPHLGFDRWTHSEVSAFAIFASTFMLIFFHCKSKPELPAVAVPVLMGLGLAVHWWSIPLPIQTIFGCGAFALAVNFLDRAPSIVDSALSLRPLRLLGMWSFSIYLWQQPFYVMVHRDGMPKTLGLALSICTGVASFYTIEKPARAWLNRVWGAKPSAVMNGPPLPESTPTAQT